MARGYFECVRSAAQFRVCKKCSAKRRHAKSLTTTLRDTAAPYFILIWATEWFGGFVSCMFMSCLTIFFHLRRFSLPGGSWGSLVGPPYVRGIPQWALGASLGALVTSWGMLGSLGFLELFLWSLGMAPGHPSGDPGSACEGLGVLW